MKFIKRHFLLIMLILTAAGIASCAVLLKNQADNYKEVKIYDVQGDRTTLQNIKISGTIADSLHKQEFEIADGAVKTVFSAVTKEERKDFYSNSISDMFDFVSYEYEPLEIPTEPKTIIVNEAVVNFWVRTKDFKSFTFNTGMTIKNEQYEYSFVYDYAGDKINKASAYFSFYDVSPNTDKSQIRQNKKTGKIYLFTKTGYDCAGFGGVYDITEQIKKSYKNNERIEVENLAPIDLKNGSVRIIDMQVSGDKMVFLTFENGEVILKPFDMSEKVFMEDINLGSFSIATANWTGLRFCSMSDERYLYFAFEMSENDEYENDKRFHTIVYDTETQRVVFSKTEDYRELPDGAYMNVEMKYKDDKLYLLRNYYQYYLSGDNIGDYQLKITVINNMGTLYDGIIASGVSEDRLYSYTNQLQAALKYREYYNLALE